LFSNFLDLLERIPPLNGAKCAPDTQKAGISKLTESVNAEFWPGHYSVPCMLLGNFELFSINSKKGTILKPLAKPVDLRV